MKTISAQYDENDDEYFNYKRPEIARHIPIETKTLLDVGCGTGAFGKYLKEVHAIEIWGSELKPSAASKAAQNLDKVITGYFERGQDYPENYFDVITFNDSLEHFPDEREPLLFAKTLLKPGGLIICSLPNVRYFKNIKHILFKKDWQYVDSGILDRTHLRFFTRKSMLRTFDELGFDVLKIQGINPGRLKGIKMTLLRLFLDTSDMKYQQYLSVLSSRN